MPEVCTVLALGIYFLTNPAIDGNSLFPGDQQTAKLTKEMKEYLKFAYRAAYSQKSRFSKWKSLYGKWMEKEIVDKDCYTRSPSAAEAVKMYDAASAAMKKLIPTGKYTTTFENLNPATLYNKLQETRST